jgi:hypothetical protein
MQVNQNVPTCVAAGTNNGCRPNASYQSNNQYSAAGDSTYHGLHVSLLERPSSWSSLRVSYTRSTAKNDLGENFFSSPIDPSDIRRDWGRSDDDQRHRLVVTGSINSPTTPARNIWEQLTHGFQVSGTLQYYSALPLNITSGVRNLQGTTSRPLADGATAAQDFDIRTVTFITRNAGTGPDFLSLNARLSRSFGLGGRVRAELLAEGFNLTNRQNVVSYNGVFGAGAYPTAPSAAFRQINAVGDPRAFQLALRLRY